MDEWYVLVTNALNVVLAETVFKHRWALQCFNSHDLRSVLVFQVVASTNRSCRTRGTGKCGKTKVWTVQVFGYVFIHR